MSYRKEKRKGRWGTLIIKKYKNRKYYCLENSKFVDEDFIIGLIKRKEDFTIIDSEENDITSPVVIKLFRK